MSIRQFLDLHGANPVERKDGEKPGHMNNSLYTTVTVKVLAVTTPFIQRDTSWWLNHPKNLNKVKLGKDSTKSGV